MAALFSLYVLLLARLIPQMVDTVTSLALQSKGIVPPTGASVNASCEFVRPAGKVGDELVGIGEVVQLG